MNHNGRHYEHDLLSRLRRVNLTETKRWALTDASNDCRAIVTRCLNHLDDCDDRDPVTEMVRDLLSLATDLSVKYDTLISSRLEDFNIDEISKGIMALRSMLGEVFQEINPAVMDKVSAAL